MEAPSDPTTTTVKKRNRLSNLAVKDLEEFYKNVTNKPSKLQREQLANQMQTAHGAAWYTERNVNLWFSNRRATARKMSNPLMSQPKATKHSPEKIETVIQLLKPLPSPPFETVALWAKLMKTSQEEVLAIIKLVQSNNSPVAEAGPSRIQTHELLPTPSPEPSMRAELSPDPTLSPITPNVNLKCPPLPRSYILAQNSLPTPTLPSEELPPLESCPPALHHEGNPKDQTSSQNSLAQTLLFTRAELLELCQDCLEPEDDSNVGEYDWDEYARPMVQFLKENGVTPLA
ncbi:hypothetical protein ONZ45_g5315 [Pleurotus djamor]|nr:hypothetical protein ONZ45_g5315 [Pleurotus djamor]